MNSFELELSITWRRGRYDSLTHQKWFKESLMKLTRLGLLDVIQYVAKNLEPFKPPSWLAYIFLKWKSPCLLIKGDHKQIQY